MKSKPIYTLSVIDANNGDSIETFDGRIVITYYKEDFAVKSGKRYEEENPGHIVHINYGEKETANGDIIDEINTSIPIAQHPAYNL